ncbi:hypothetical protein AJ87_37575 [Rhizobium yanglingense]|nr:hypothetical protein AJ87_37575 [Rhizobium yanglingense]
MFATKLSDLPRSALLLAASTIGFAVASTVAYLLGIHVRLETVGTLAGLVAFFLFPRCWQRQ